MTTEAQVRAAKGPPEALLAIAKALDRIESALTTAPAVDDGWGTWVALSEERSPAAGGAFTIEDEGNTVDIKPVSPEQKIARLAFADKHLRLEEAFPNIGAVEAYVNGGPVWLYEYDRDFLLQQPAATRQMVVADLNLTDVQAAIEMGRDLLMDRGQGDAPATGGTWV